MSGGTRVNKKLYNHGRTIKAVILTIQEMAEDCYENMDNEMDEAEDFIYKKDLMDILEKIDDKAEEFLTKARKCLERSEER